MLHPSNNNRLRLSVLLATAALTATAHAQPSELWKINADGTGLAKFADTPGYTCGSPEWSPDGKFVAYDTWKLGQKLEDSQIVVIRADGTDPRNIGIGAMPSWSPDGRQIVVHTYGVGSDGQRTSDDCIVVMNADGTGRETVLKHWGSPRWLRQGNRIVTILNSNLALYDLATGIERVILPRPYPIYWGYCVSPDCKRFAFCGSDSGLYLATLDEQTVKATVRTLAAAGNGQYSSFAPDSKRFVFSWLPAGSKKGTTSQLYTMDVDADAAPHLLPGQNAAAANWSPHWSPDGKTIVFCSRIPKSPAKPLPENPESTP
jgi:Tol biopolymer transport system component